MCMKMNKAKNKIKLNKAAPTAAELAFAADFFWPDFLPGVGKWFKAIVGKNELLLSGWNWLFSQTFARRNQGRDLEPLENIMKPDRSHRQAAKNQIMISGSSIQNNKIHRAAGIVSSHGLFPERNSARQSQENK